MVLASDLADWARELVMQAGGSPEDVQVVEQIAQTGAAQVCVCVSPRVTRLDEEVFLSALRQRFKTSSRGGQLASEVRTQRERRSFRAANPGGSLW